VADRERGEVWGLAVITVDLPVVEIVDFATTVGMTEHHFGPRYERVRVKHPTIRAALRRLTGKDFGYDQSARQKWLQSEEAAGISPPWEPIRFSTGPVQESEGTEEK